MVNTDDCWHFAGYILHGYGVKFVSRNGTHHTIRMHRVFYTMYKGEIPEGLVIDHLCKVKRCINPDHLEAVTNRENCVVRGAGPAAINFRKTHCHKGHEFSPENTISRENKRRCRTCSRERSRLRYRLKRESHRTS